MGQISDGMSCVETNTGKLTRLDFEQTVEFLEPQPATTASPARAGAVCRSTADEDKLKTAVETMCRLLGKRCSYEVRQMIERTFIK